jgi:hypothetical protein
VSEDLVPPEPVPDARTLLALAALADFLVRSRRDRQAIVAVERLGRALFGHYQSLQAARSDLPGEIADCLERKAVIAIVEVKMMSDRLRRGQAPLSSQLRLLVDEAITLDDVIGVVA